MRKLVTIRRISELYPIPGADLIERAKIDGWNVVVKKGDFRAGDLCVYGEIDAVFPSDDERFAFLEGKRLRTKKMRGVVSQGIAFPLSILGEAGFSEGDEVTELLRVVKYDPPPPKSMEAKGEFPWFVPKTDAERVQNLPLELKENLGKAAFVTEKLDGSSITIYARRGFQTWETGVCSRNLELKLETENHYTSTVKKLVVREKLEDFCLSHDRQLALQGEIVGAGIQGNRYKLPETNIRFFNAYDIGEQKPVPPEEFLDLIERLELETVPVLQSDYLLHDDIERYLAEAEDKSLLNPAIHREGLVFRSTSGSFIFKAISNKFLLKND